MMLLFLLLIVNINALQWCEEIKEDKITIKCFENVIQNECIKNDFIVIENEKKIIVKGNKRKENVEIDCEIMNNFEIIFENNEIGNKNLKGLNLCTP